VSQAALSSGVPQRARIADPRWATVAKRNSGGVARTQALMADSVGRRRNVACSSSAGRRAAYVASRSAGRVPSG